MSLTWLALSWDLIACVCCGSCGPFCGQCCSSLWPVLWLLWPVPWLSWLVLWFFVACAVALVACAVVLVAHAVALMVCAINNHITHPRPSSLWPYHTGCQHHRGYEAPSNTGLLTSSLVSFILHFVYSLGGYRSTPKLTGHPCLSG